MFFNIQRIVQQKTCLDIFHNIERVFYKKKILTQLQSVYYEVSWYFKE